MFPFRHPGLPAAPWWEVRAAVCTEHRAGRIAGFTATDHVITAHPLGGRQDTLRIRQVHRKHTTPWPAVLWSLELHPDTTATGPFHIETPTHTDLLGLFGAWASTPGHAASWTQVAQEVNTVTCRYQDTRPLYSAFDQYPIHTDTAMMFARKDPWDGNTGPLYPPRRGDYLTGSYSDGRFEFDGYREPYPGCWTAEAVWAGHTGGLSAMWPYLT